MKYLNDSGVTVTINGIKIDFKSVTVAPPKGMASPSNYHDQIVVKMMDGSEIEDNAGLVVIHFNDIKK